MNVVAHAGAVARRIVVAINLDILARPGGCLQNQRNQVCFRIVPFAATFGRGGSVEITKRHGMNSISLVIAAQCVLERYFCFAVGIGWIGRISFFNWLLLWLAVHRPS